MEVLRDEEFAPVKNAPGAAKDSPDTAQAAVLALHRRCALSVLKDTPLLQMSVGLIVYQVPGTACTVSKARGASS